MRLSALQKYVLKECLAAKHKLYRGKLLNYYKNKKKKPSVKDQITIIARSINRLIVKGMLIGYGKRTPEKWYFDFISLTPQGKQAALNLYKKNQQKLPLRKKKS